MSERTSLAEWLSEPDKVARRGEVWNVIHLVLKIEQRNRWYWRLWRWVTGSAIVDQGGLRIWNRLTGARPPTLDGKDG